MFDSIAAIDMNNLPPHYRMAVVVFNNDPDKQQRIKVFIPNVLEGPADQLPWVGPIAQSPFGITRSFGTVNVPVLDSIVIVHFQGGDLNSGLYLGNAVTKTLGENMPVELSTNYPSRYGSFDPKGNKKYTDLVTGVVEYIHNTGTRVKFLANGDLDVTVVGSLHANVTGNAAAVIGGSANVNVSGTTTLVSGGNVTATAPLFTMNGPVQINGGLSVSGTTTSTGTINTQGAVIAQGDVTAGSISLINHHHPDPQGGSVGSPT